MRTRIAAAIASLLFASLGTAAYANGAQQTPPQQMPPQQTMPPQEPTPQQTMPPQPATSSTSASATGGEQSMQGNDRSNDRIEQKVKHELKVHGVTATDVTVSFNDGTATLTGTVANHRDIAKAKKAAMRVRGVKHVDTSGLQARSAQSSSQSQG